MKTKAHPPRLMAVAVAHLSIRTYRRAFPKRMMACGMTDLDQGNRLCKPTRRHLGFRKTPRSTPERQQHSRLRMRTPVPESNTRMTRGVLDSMRTAAKHPQRHRCPASQTEYRRIRQDLWKSKAPQQRRAHQPGLRRPLSLNVMVYRQIEKTQRRAISGDSVRAAPPVV